MKFQVPTLLTDTLPEGTMNLGITVAEGVPIASLDPMTNS